MKRYIRFLKEWTEKGDIAWDYFPEFGNLYGDYAGGDVSLCQLENYDRYYKLTVNCYTVTDKGVAMFYITRTDPDFSAIESFRNLAIRHAKRIQT